MNILVVVDMQNDFVTGVLGSEMAAKILPDVKKKIAEFDGEVLFTRDTHAENYLETNEGKNLPVPHCVKGTDGWQICSELSSFVKEGENTLDKPSFGSMELPKKLQSISDKIDKIEFCGVCTDICVISNAVILKAAFPESDIVVDASCCAGVSEQSHKTALDAMKALWINVTNQE